MILTVTNALALKAGEFVPSGLNVYNDNLNCSSIMLNSNGDGNFIRSEGMGFTPVNTPILDNTDVSLRLTWDATAQTFHEALGLAIWLRRQTKTAA